MGNRKQVFLSTQINKAPTVVIQRATRVCVNNSFKREPRGSLSECRWRADVPPPPPPPPLLPGRLFPRQSPAHVSRHGALAAAALVHGLDHHPAGAAHPALRQKGGLGGADAPSRNQERGGHKRRVWRQMFDLCASLARG